ncbi:MAG TPA: amidohydrolase family protein [Rhizomicrobium sp.]|jgi:predicted TIM-barrel fold metal-dependent hydrolase|nr:amidohydrolase family protein [Rhizomicrobium sp.]
MGAIPFVDAHVHMWDLSRIHYPWLSPPFRNDGPNGSVEPIARNYLLEDYTEDSKNWDVRGMVHVDAGADASAALDETAWLQAMADARGLPNAIVAFAGLNDPNLEKILEVHAESPNVRGIRHIVNWHKDPGRSYTARDVTGDPQWAKGFAALAKYGLSFDLQAYPGQFSGLARLVARHPEIPVIINHLGMPVITDEDGISRWRSGMRALAASPHVCVKLSGVGFIRRDWTIDLIRPFLLEAIDMFGPGRCLFASDYPTDKLFGSFDRHLDAYSEIVSAFSEDERRAMFGGNAVRVYRMDIGL